MKKIQRKIILLGLFSILGIAFTFGQLTCNENVVASLTIGGDNEAKVKLFTQSLLENESGFDNLEASRDGVTFGDYIEYYCCDVGQNIFHVRGTDAAGNVETCTGTLLIEDKLAPVAIVNGPVYLGLFGESSVELTIDMLPIEVIDNCSSSTIALSQSIFTSLGTYNVSYTLSDESGNSASGNIEVIVISGNVIVCNSFINVSLDNNGIATITPDMVLEGAILGNGIYQLSVDGGPFEDFVTIDCGAPGVDEIQVTIMELTTQNQCWSMLSIEDKLHPIIDIPYTVHLSLGGASEVELTSEMLSPYVHENCSIESHNLSQSIFTSAGTYNVTYTVTDTEGNVTTKVLEVKVTENGAVLSCFNNTEIELDNQGSVTISPYIQMAGIYLNYNFKVGVGDSEEDIIELFDQITLDCSHLGTNVIEVRDESTGNTCWGTILVKDVDAPTPYAINQVVVTLNGSEPYVLDPALVDGGSFDNCEVGSMIVSPSTFYVPGTYEVKLRVFDTSGNSDYALTTVIVEGGDTQSMECIGLSTALTEQFGPTELWAVDFVLNDEDFDSFSMSLNPSGPYTETFNFDCSMFDLNTPIDVYVRGEVDGEYSYCSVGMTLLDVTPPVAIADQGITLQLVNGQAILTTGMVDDGSYDLCGNISYSLSQTLFTNADIGENTVILTITDGSGNSNTVFAIVTVLSGGNGCTINDVLFPDDIMITDVDADLEDLTPENLQINYGFTYEEVYATTILDCDNIATTYSDILIPAGWGGKILRDWTALDWLTAEIGTGYQIIKLYSTPNTALACIDNVTVNVDNGSVQLIPEDVLEGSNYDFSTISLVIFDQDGDSILDNTLTNAYIGMTLEYFVSDTITGNNCWGNINVINDINGCPLDVDNEVIFPLDEIFLSNNNLDPVQYSPENLVVNFGYEVSDVNVVINASPCAIVGYTFEDDVFNYIDGNFKIVRTFTVIDWITFDPPSDEGLYTHTQVINVGFNPNDFICDVLPNSAPVGNCDTGHTLEDDVEWPSDLSIADYRISPEELIEFSGVLDIDAEPIFYNTPDDYTTTYIDLLEEITSSSITINRVWKAEKEDYGISWHYSQSIFIDFSDFENLVSVNTTTDRAMSGVSINDAIFTDSQGNAQVLEDVYDIDYEDHYVNGINVRDIIIIQRHILGLEDLDESMWDAADFTDDNMITAADLLTISKTIQGITTTYQWKFIDVSDQSAMLKPKAIYSAYKRGDVDDSALLAGSDPLVASTKFKMNDLLLNNGESYDVPVFLNEDLLLHGLEMRIGIDPSLIDINSVTGNLDFQSLQYNINNENELVILMHDVSTLQAIADVEDGAVVYLNITAKANGLLNEALDVDNKFSFGVDENIDLIVIGGQLDGIIGTGTNSEELSAIKVFPNPTSDVLNIDLSGISISGDMTLEVFNMSGKKLLQVNNQSIIDVTSLNGGMYYYRVKIREYQTTGRFIVVD